MKSPDVRLLAWSIFALALSLPATAWVWSHGERPAVPVAPAMPRPFQQVAPLYGATRVKSVPVGIPVGFMDAEAVIKNNGAEARYTINCDAQVQVNVISPAGGIVRSLGSSPAPSGVEQTVFWDRCDNSGKFAPLHEYDIQIMAKAVNAANAGDGMAQIKKRILLPMQAIEFDLPKTR